MIADIGRTTCNLTAPNSEVFAFFNSAILNTADINYHVKDVSTPRYKITFNDLDKKRKYRALHYARYLPNGVMEANPRLVPFLDYDVTPDDTIMAAPLYEAITPTLGELPGRPVYNLVFWTNLNEKKNTLIADGNGVFAYDKSKILRFENDKLEEVDLDSYSVKLLCSAQIAWERLATRTGNVYDAKPILTPVIRSIYVLMVQEGNIAVDFSTGGGGGLRRHNHSDNNNAGFSYAVFAPGTSLQPINWK